MVFVERGKDLPNRNLFHQWVFTDAEMLVVFFIGFLVSNRAMFDLFIEQVQE